ncbi:MAG TPA: hypothetical protein VH107_07855, partial [Lacipirellulaceae bacterium]|nr:hypothetical protein [Lacipirellulaceae bacterium]
MIEAFAFFVIAAIGTRMTLSAIPWAAWYARRSLRSRRFSLRSLLFAITIISLLLGAFSVLLHNA